MTVLVSPPADAADASSPQDQRRTLAVRYVADAFEHPPEPPAQFIEGLAGPGELVVLAAARGLGKSFLVAQLAACLGIGSGLFLDTLPVRRSARVLIAQGEVDFYEAFRRWQLITGDNGPPPGVAETFDRWRLRVTRHRSTLTSDIGHESREWFDVVLDPRLEETISTHSLDVLIIDPWAVYFAGNENSNDEVEAALDKLRDLAMRHDLAVLIVHHLSKAIDVREPEDAWRGASRLADWASTRITLLPHYTAAQAAAQGMTRQQARRYADVRFLRRSTPIDDFSILLDVERGGWRRWEPPEEHADTRRITMNPVDVADACRADGGSWPSIKAASRSLGCAPHTAEKLLAGAVRAELLEHFSGPRGGRGYRLPEPSLTRADNVTP